MPAVIPWAEGELQTLAADPHSKIFSDLRKITVVLQPFHLQDLKTAVRDLLNAGVNRYDKSLDGILLGYDQLKVLSKSASVSAESSGVAIEIQANFYTFRPEIGCILKGIVNKISNDHVGILVYQRFNVSCPRPGLDAKSAKWIGNNVVMHQEVVFKLREKNFSGKLPFLQGKIMEIGNVVTGLSEHDKKSKKKLKEIVPDESNLTETPSQVTKKNRKHKLEESEENIEVKTKKSKKDAESLKRPIERDVDVSVAGSELSSLKQKKKKKRDSIGSSDETSFMPVEKDIGVSIVGSELSSVKQKKKKKVSIGSVDETDFIPRLSLDVSQLPEDLPPPNADSTHFDLAKNLSISMKSDKKKNKKVNNTDLTAIREESADGSKVNSRLHDKSQQLNEEKTKKKLKTSIQEPCPSASEDVPLVKTPKKKNSKEKKPVELNLPPPSSTKQVLKQAEASTTKIVESTPVKNKKSKKEKSIDISQLNAGPQNEATVGNEVKNLLSPSKAKKKKSKEDMLETSQAKVKKSKEDKLHSSATKGKDVASSSLTSDDIIPPGQKSFRASPKKHSGGSPLKDESHSVNIANSPGIEYFAANRSMMDPELGTRRSGRQVPLMFGSLEGKIPGPPDSPIKSSAGKRVENNSDSDSPPPKKLVISTNSQHSSDSSDTENEQAAGPTKMTPQKPTKDDSDDSDFETAPQNRLLLSMGVMQSPFKSAVSIVKPDPSESESEVSSDEDRAPGKVLNVKSGHTKNVPKGSPNPTKQQESDSDDDLDVMKASMLEVAEDRKSKNKTSKNKPSKLNSNDKVGSSKKDISEKTSISKTSENVSQKGSKLNSVPSDDSDSDTDLIKSAMLKVQGMASGATSLSKLKQGKPKVAKNLPENSAAKKTKLKPANKINEELSKQPTHKPEYDDSDEDEDEIIKAAIQAAVTNKSEKKTKGAPVKKTKLKAADTISTSVSHVSKSKPHSDDSDEDGNEIMKAAVQAAVKTKSEKTKAAPVKKTKLKAVDTISTSVSHVSSKDSKSKPHSDDSDEDEKEIMKAAVQAAAKTKSEKKTKAAPVKKTKLKAADTIPTSVSLVSSKGSKNKPDSDDSDEDINKMTKAAKQINAVPPKPSDDSDSDTDLIKSAMLKVQEMASGATSLSKLKQGKPKVAKNLPENSGAKKTKLKPTDKISTSVSQVSTKDLKKIPDMNDSDDSDEVLKAAMLSVLSGNSKVKSKSAKEDLTTKGKKLLNKSEPKLTETSNSSRVKNMSSESYDSDSGPDDVNTTDMMAEMRQKQAETKSVKPVKNQKNSGSVKSSSKKKAALGDLQDVASEDIKSKSSKANTSKKVAVEQNSTSGKKSKDKKKADEEISNVMQRLIKQAQLSRL